MSRLPNELIIKIFSYTDLETTEEGIKVFPFIYREVILFKILNEITKIKHKLDECNKLLE